MKFLKVYDKALAVTSKVFEVIGIVALVMMMLILGGQSIASWFGVSWLWSDEMAFMMNFWVIYIGAAVVMYYDKHVQVDMVVKMLPKKFTDIWEVFRLGLCLFVCVYMLCSAISYLGATANVTTVVLKMPKIVYYIVPVISFSYFILTLINRFVWQLVKLFGKEVQA